MRRALFVLAVLFGSSPALAQDAFSLQRFRPAVDSQGMVTVNASQPLAHLAYSLGLVASYANETLRLHDANASFSVDHFVTVQLQASLGLLGAPRWSLRMHGIGLQLGVTLPVHIMAGALSVDGERQTFSGQSIGDIGLNLKVRFLNPARHHMGLALVLAVDFPSGKSAQFLGEGQTTLRSQLIMDKALGRDKRVRVSFNAGALVRRTTHTFDQVITGQSRSLGTEVTYALGAAFGVVPHRFDLVTELFGSLDMASPHGGDPLELLAAAKVYLAESSFFEIGASAGLLPRDIVDGKGNMTGLPLVRGFVGFVFEPTVGDRDHDRIKNDMDLCPDEPETRNGFQDEDGCPDEVPAPPAPKPAPAPTLEPTPVETPSLVRRQGGQIVSFEKVYFKTASAEILPRSFPMLDDLFTLLSDSPNLTLVEISGHADERGDDAYNLALTHARARSVRKYLVDEGIADDRLLANGYGERQPAVDAVTQKPCVEHSERCWEKNRRVEFRIVGEAQ